MLTGGQVAGLIVAVFFAILVLVLCMVLVKLGKVVEETQKLVAGITDQTVPLLGEVTTSVTHVNQELVRVDAITANVQSISGNVSALTSLFAAVDLLFFAASASKVLDGGWFPLAVALVASTVLMTWDRGRRLVTARRTQQEGPLRAFVEDIHGLRPPVQRVAGTAIFLNADPATTPLALRANGIASRTLGAEATWAGLHALHGPTASGGAWDAPGRPFSERHTPSGRTTLAPQRTKLT